MINAVRSDAVKTDLHVFDSQIKTGGSFSRPHQFSNEEIKNEPMLFNCNLHSAIRLGGPITRAFLYALMAETDNPFEIIKYKDWQITDEWVIDSRVHMLMPGWYPCIPGFHHDDVPRERADGQPEYDNPSYRSKHVMGMVGGCSYTQFAIGEANFPRIPENEVCYKVWHPIVEKYLEHGKLESVMAENGKLIFFDDRTWHQGTKSVENGWRFFIRVSTKTKRVPTNELRHQVQVYLENPMEGW